jgi:hypothetical protein
VVWRRGVWLGKAGESGLAVVRLCKDGHGRHGGARLAGSGSVWQDRLGKDGKVWRSLVGRGRNGADGEVGKVGLGWLGRNGEDGEVG